MVAIGYCMMTEQRALADLVAESVPCGPDLDKFVDSLRLYVDAGYTEVALTQIGPDQDGFCKVFIEELGPKLRKL